MFRRAQDKAKLLLILAAIGLFAFMTGLCLGVVFDMGNAWEIASPHFGGGR